MTSKGHVSIWTADGSAVEVLLADSWHVSTSTPPYLMVRTGPYCHFYPITALRKWKIEELR